jgi:hypothetical protein
MPCDKKKITFCIAVFCALCSVLPADAAVTFLGTGSLPANGTDLSGLTGTLESGASPSLLGGIGSAIAYTGVGGRFLVLPDRGPNATPYDSAVDDTTSYIDRFHEVNLAITPSGASFTITPSLISTTLLSSATPLTGKATADNPNKTFFTGLSSGFDAANGPNSMRLDPEGIRVSNNGKNVYVSDEYGPHVYEFDRATGQRIRTFNIPDHFNIATPTATGNTELPPGNASGRQANRGMEGLAITPDGKTLVGIMQNPLIQDGALVAGKRTGINDRIITIDIATGTTHEYLYQLTDGINNGVNEIVAVNDHEFLVIERDGKAGNSAAFKKIFKVDLTGATDISNIVLPTSGTPASVTAVSKAAFLDLLDSAFGLKGTTFPEKIEGVAFGPDLADGRHTLIVTNDNDFLGATNNNFYVFAIDKNELDFVPQAFSAVPEPSTNAMLVAGACTVLLALRRRR